MLRRVTLAAGTVAGLAGLLAVPAVACHKHTRTVEKRFAVDIPVPLHAYAQHGGYTRCVDSQTPAVDSHHVEEFVAPAAGRLRIELTDFLGDWDVVLFRDGESVAEGGPTRTPLRMSDGSAIEVLEYTFTAPGPSEIVICNFLGGAQGNGKYEFTYAK
ncbi:MAG TPA: hypothetical protein VNB94_13710 [Mycobacteriales bacterium]|nr:hypothetical protein [Mycobacteriales bacterium]